MVRKQILLWLGAFVVGLAGISWLGTEVFLLTSKDPLRYSVSTFPLWPIACSTQGCITTNTWFEYHARAKAFSLATTQSDVSLEQSLTTVLRQYLVQHAFLKQPVSASDAKRYREEILHITSRDQLQQAGIMMSLQDYDQLVVLPLLLQEALRQERSVESSDELYHVLADERKIVLLSTHFRWNIGNGSVERR